MYILSLTDYPSDGYTNFLITDLSKVGNILYNDKFLSEYDYLFEEGITGYKVEKIEEYVFWKVTVQFYSYTQDIEERELYLFKVNVI